MISGVMRSHHTFFNEWSYFLEFLFGDLPKGMYDNCEMYHFETNFYTIAFLMTIADAESTKFLSTQFPTSLQKSWKSKILIIEML